jgi:hypothetical protein
MQWVKYVFPDYSGAKLMNIDLNYLPYFLGQSNERNAEYPFLKGRSDNKNISNKKVKQKNRSRTTRTSTKMGCETR